MDSNALSEVFGDRAELARLLLTAREIVLPRMRECLDWLSEPTRQMALYHFGWLDENGHDGDFLGAGRTMLISLLAATIDGGRWDRARDATVAFRILCAAILIHDDIIDADRTRRGRPALWVRYGSGEAIQAAAALYGLAFEVLSERPVRSTGFAVHILSHAAQECATGQILDLRAERTESLGIDDAFCIAAAKTSSITRCAAHLGATCANVQPERAQAMAEFGHCLGMIIQIRDDMTDIWGEPGEEAAPRRSDIRARKKTFPVAAALSTGAVPELAEFYRGSQTPSDEDIARIVDLLDRCGGQAWCADQLHRHHDLALERLAQAAPEPRAARLLTDLVDLIMNSSVGDSTTVLRSKAIKSVASEEER